MITYHYCLLCVFAVGRTHSLLLTQLYSLLALVAANSGAYTVCSQDAAAAGDMHSNRTADAPLRFLALLHLQAHGYRTLHHFSFLLLSLPRPY